MPPLTSPSPASLLRRLALAVGLLAGLVAAAPPALAQGTASSLRVAISQAHAPPFVVWREAVPVGGFDLELAQALAEQLHTRLESVVLPQLRLEAAAAAGEVDLLCHVAPAALRERQNWRWSPPLLELPDLLLGHSGSRVLDRLEQLPAGAALGTVQGFSYAALDAQFADERLKRDDALSEERLLRKLQLQRHPYAVLNLHASSWAGRQPDLGGLASWRLPLAGNRYHCAVPPKGRWDAAPLLEAVEQLRRSGRFDQILGRHVQPALAVVVSNRSELAQLEREHLVALFLGQRYMLPDGSAPSLVMLAGREREQFMRTVLRREAADYQAAWSAQQFGGRRRAPLELRDAEEVKAHLRRHAEAIAYLPLSQVDASLRVVFMP